MGETQTTSDGYFRAVAEVAISHGFDVIVPLERRFGK